mmetsp:Transcript_28115/g.63872  ORF Transcript_28115/g.63872 Transcript_28115/m.63872 type:complete len:188 (+) Transcript_28115:33-596(+)
MRSNYSDLEGVLVSNASEDRIKVCIYKASDMLQWVPLGGINGSGVRFLEPRDEAAFELPPGEYIVKVFRPGLIDVPCLEATVLPGQSVVFSKERPATVDNGAVVGAAMVAGAAGVLLVGPIAGVVMGAAAAFAGRRDDEVGTGVRAVGRAGGAIAESAKDFGTKVDEKFQVKKQVKSLVAKQVMKSI